MKNLLLLFLFCYGFTWAQEDAWVYFTNKPDADFYLNNPLEMLSQRALDRRATQGIAPDATDVPVHADYILQVSQTPGITVMAQSRWFNALHVRGEFANIQALQSLPFVASVSYANHNLNAGRPLQEKFEPVNKNLDIQVDFPYGNSANQIQMLNGHLLHQQDYTGAGKIIAVLDAGYPGVNTLGAFARLRDNNLILGGYNFPDRDNNIYSRSNHGTLVLSTMGGYVQNQLVGTAPDAAYYLFITEDIFSENPVEESYWVEAAEMADSLGVDVINSSLGYFGYDNPNYSYQYADMNGITGFASRGATLAASKGMAVVVSAGNSGAGANPHINVPSDAINVLAVGAVNASGQYAAFSSIGPSSDGRVKPDVMAQGQASVVANTQGNVVTGSGTSFAGPILAGMVASLWQAAPGLTSTQIMQVIRESAHLFSNPNPQFGYGIPNFEQALQQALGTQDFAGQVVVIYPNPFQASLKVSMQRGEFSLFDSTGRLILQQSLSSNPIDTAHLKAGVYFYRLTSGGVRTGKLIKQ